MSDARVYVFVLAAARCFCWRQSLQVSRMRIGSERGFWETWLLKETGV